MADSGDDKDKKFDVLKLAIVGSGAVGKSSLCIQYVMGHFATQYDPTIEDSYRKQVRVDDHPFLLDILDTAGQEELRTIQDQYFRDCDGFILVYSVTSKESFKGLTAQRSSLLKCRDTGAAGESFIPMVLVGNKCDIVDGREVTKQEGEQLAKTFGAIPFLESSAKDKLNVDEIFMELVRVITKYKEKPGGGGAGGSGNGGGAGGNSNAANGSSNNNNNNGKKAKKGGCNVA